jgi:phenylacetate-CoA ligase
MPVLQEVAGRVEDVVTGPDGRKLVRFHGVFVDMPTVQEGQIVQEGPRAIRVRVLPAERFGEADVKAIKQRIAARMGPEVETTVELVDHIPRTAAGKFKAVVSLLEDGDAGGPAVASRRPS